MDMYGLINKKQLILKNSYNKREKLLNSQQNLKYNNYKL